MATSVDDGNFPSVVSAGFDRMRKVPCSAHDIFVNKTHSLILQFGLLFAVIAATPVLAIKPGWLGPQLLTLVVALLLVLLPSAPEADVQRSLEITKPLAATALLPALWMAVQMIPIPLGSIDHPIWRSAAAAVSESLSGHISIDLGFTLRALFGYLSLAALAFVTAVLTRDRVRAERLLFGICTITTFAAIELTLLSELPALKSAYAPRDVVRPLLALAAFGSILNVAFVVRTNERYKTRGSREPHSLHEHIGMMLAGIGGEVICLIALVHLASPDTLLAAAFGVTAFGLVVLIRRLNFSRWAAATVCTAVAVACAGGVALRFAANPGLSPLFRFANVVSTDDATAALRMVSDATWAGAGVGTYGAVAAIYRDATGAPGETAINTVMLLILEWGYVGLLATIALLLQLIATLFRGALARGRDSFYAAGAAGCLVTASFEALCDASFTELAVQMMAAIIIGLGLSQSIGRRPA